RAFCFGLVFGWVRARCMTGGATLEYGKRNMDDSLNFDTLAVRAGTLRSSDFNEHSEALFLTSSFCFKSAAEAAERFANSEDYFTYSRFTNPTVTMFQDR